MLSVEIITPDKTLYEGSAKLVQLPGSDGSFELLDRHVPIISTLKKGKIKLVNENGQEEFIEVAGGVIELLNNRLVILAEPVKA